jgi:hypothetical protein
MPKARTIWLKTVIVLLAILGAIFAWHYVRQSQLHARLHAKLEAKCVADAELAVAEYLREHSPPGTFQSISGSEAGYGGPGFSPAGYFLQARRVAHYSDRDDQSIRICVFPRHPTQPTNVGVYMVQDNVYSVSHPDLTGE